MIRQYGAQRCRGGDPLRVGVIAVGSIYYLRECFYFDNNYGGRAVCRTPYQVEAFLNGTCGAARRSRHTGMWEEAYRTGRSDTALVRSLRDRRQVRRVSVHLLIVHHDLGLSKKPTGYPTLPDHSLYRRAAHGGVQRGDARPSARAPCCTAPPTGSVAVRTEPGDGGSATDPASLSTQESTA